jgi:cytochrome c
MWGAAGHAPGPFDSTLRRFGSRCAMDSFEVNKILGAILGTCLVTLALNIAAGAMFAPVKPEKPGYEVAVVEHPAEAAQPEAAAPAEPIEKLLASASVDKGEQSAKKCMACHTFTKGGPNRIGPNLWGIVNRPKGSEAGFTYSDAVKGKGGNWTIDDLNAFLTSPRTFAPGTKMTFVGLPKASERAENTAPGQKTQ